MKPRDFTARRIFVGADLSDGARVDLDRVHANHLVNVLRMTEGGEILVFNGRDGEWRARLRQEGKKAHSLDVGDRVRPQPPAANLDYLFAPLKQARLDYMVQKAVEMGVGRLRPVLTRHTQVARLNLDRVEANVIAAAEQCGNLSIPPIEQPVTLARLLDAWPRDDAGRRIVFCDEAHEDADPLAVLERLEPAPMAVLIGPEGGFSEDERRQLRGLPFVTALPLGPRILRADTAAVAALALVQAALGDWQSAPAAPD
jgi:16S rRNA (uracil1498-N3)-methyltransferase